MVPGFEQVNAYIGLLAVLVNLTLAAWVILRSSHHPVYITFMLVCFSIAFWNFGDFMVYASGHDLWPPAGTGHPSPWKYFSSSGSAMAVAFLFHFMCATVRQVRKRQVLIFMAYITGAFFALTSPLAIYHGPVKAFVDGTPWNILFGVTLVPFIAGGLALLVVAAFRAGDTAERNRFLFTILAIAITAAAGLTDLVQKLEFPVLPLGHIGSVIGPCVLAAGIVKHRRVFDILAITRVKLDAMSEMAAGIAHEIRNPLTAIEGSAQLLSRELEEGNLQEARKYHQIITDEIRRLDGILGSFQDFTRPLTLHREVRSINEIIERTVAMARIEDPGIILETSLDAGIPALEIDPALMRQVLINLFLNAYQACGSDGIVRITTRSSPPWIVTDIRDNGPGIPPEIRARIFEPFFSTRVDGHGVGLAICRRIIDAHGGRIEAVGDNGGGGHIRIYLPAPG